MKFIKAEKAVTKVTCEFTVEELKLIRAALYSHRDYSTTRENYALGGDVSIAIHRAENEGR
jgi:hypothetical protein